LKVDSYFSLMKSIYLLRIDSSKSVNSLCVFSTCFKVFLILSWSFCNISGISNKSNITSGGTVLAGVCPYVRFDDVQVAGK